MVNVNVGQLTGTLSLDWSNYEQALDAAAKKHEEFEKNHATIMAKVQAVSSGGGGHGGGGGGGSKPGFSESIGETERLATALRYASSVMGEFGMRSEGVGLAMGALELRSLAASAGVLGLTVAGGIALAKFIELGSGVMDTEVRFATWGRTSVAAAKDVGDSLQGLAKYGIDADSALKGLTQITPKLQLATSGSGLPGTGPGVTPGGEKPYLGTAQDLMTVSAQVAKTLGEDSRRTSENIADVSIAYKESYDKVARYMQNTALITGTSTDTVAAEALRVKKNLGDAAPDIEHFAALTTAVQETGAVSGKQAATATSGFVNALYGPDARSILGRMGISTVTPEGKFVDTDTVLGQFLQQWQNPQAIKQTGMSQTAIGRAIWGADWSQNLGIMGKLTSGGMQGNLDFIEGMPTPGQTSRQMNVGVSGMMGQFGANVKNLIQGKAGDFGAGLVQGTEFDPRVQQLLLNPDLSPANRDVLSHLGSGFLPGSANRPNISAMEQNPGGPPPSYGMLPGVIAPESPIGGILSGLEKRWSTGSASPSSKPELPSAEDILKGILGKIGVSDIKAPEPESIAQAIANKIGGVGSIKLPTPGDIASAIAHRPEAAPPSKPELPSLPDIIGHITGGRWGTPSSPPSPPPGHLPDGQLPPTTPATLTPGGEGIPGLAGGPPLVGGKYSIPTPIGTPTAQSGRPEEEQILKGTQAYTASIQAQTSAITSSNELANAQQHLADMTVNGTPAQIEQAAAVVAYASAANQAKDAAMQFADEKGKAAAAVPKVGTEILQREQGFATMAPQMQEAMGGNEEQEINALQRVAAAQKEVSAAVDASSMKKAQSDLNDASNAASFYANNMDQAKQATLGLNEAMQGAFGKPTKEENVASAQEAQIKLQQLQIMAPSVREGRPMTGEEKEQFKGLAYQGRGIDLEKQLSTLGREATGAQIKAQSPDQFTNEQLQNLGNKYFNGEMTGLEQPAVSGSAPGGGVVAAFQGTVHVTVNVGGKEVADQVAQALSEGQSSGPGIAPGGP